MNLAPVVDLLDRLGARCALIGAHAMAVRGYPRFTVDVDLLTSDPRVLEPQTWEPLRGSGAAIETRKGDHDDPLGGVVHILLADDTDVDVVLAKWTWEAEVIARAEPVTMGGVVVNVPRTSDLILLKLAAGGYGDLQDAAALLSLGDAVAMTREVETHIANVRPDVRALWRDLLDRR